MSAPSTTLDRSPTTIFEVARYFGQVAADFRLAAGSFAKIVANQREMAGYLAKVARNQREVVG